jgi:predicted ester cyclase
MTTAETTARQVLRRMFDEGFSTGDDTVESGDTIWVRARGRGTATGPFFGAPSGRPLDFTVIDVARVVDGRIVEHWGVPDRFAVLAQTGVLARLA